MAKKADIETKIAALGDLSREQLVATWRRIYNSDPPTGVRRELLMRAAAFQLQEKQFGGMSSEGKRTLRAAMKTASKQLSVRGDPVAAALQVAGDVTCRHPVRPGARLIRDWNGKTHIVDVTESGFLFEGMKYRSLSGIAKKITGTSWSGPRFFGQ